MQSPLEVLRWERRRKLQVREAFRAGLARLAGSGTDPAPFYAASAAYLVSAQRRLIDQDMRLAELLEPRVPTSQAADHDAIGSLRDRLQQSDAALHAFQEATRVYAERGNSARQEFETAALAYIDFIVNVLGARSHSLRHLTTTLFSDADWDQIAGVMPAVLADEAALFQRVRAAAPAGCDPDTVSTERPQPT